MKKLFSIMCTMILVFGFAAGQAFAIGYSKDINPTIQPGTDFDDEITIPAGTQVTIDVQVNDVSLPLISAGVSLVYDPDMITVISSSIYDSEEIAREDGGTNWDPELSNTIDMGPLTVPYEGLNGYTVLCGELDLVSPLNGDIPVARFVLECQDPGDAEVMFMPSIDVDTVVGEGGIVFDGDMVPNTVIIHQVEDTDGDGLFDYQDNCPEHPNGPELGTCTRGTVGEICSSNQNCGTGGVCSMNQEDMDIDGVGDVCDTVQICKGNFDFDGDVDGTDAALFKSHFGRGGYTNPCPPDGPAPVEKTWQTTSYATGDDGDLEKGVVWPAPRFTDNDDGTVRDNLTGLIWLKHANCFGTRTWDHALSVCNGLGSGSCGLTDGSSAGDWRLPNRKELFSLVHDGYYTPALPDTLGTGQWTEGNPFTNVLYEFGLYWSSSTYVSGSAWLVSMENGVINAFSKASLFAVWPVRGGN